MGFAANVRSDGLSQNKAIKAKYTRKVAAYSEDLEKVVEVGITINTVVLDTTPEGVQEDAKVAGGSIKLGEHGSASYKSEAGDILADRIGEVFAADIAGENAEAPKKSRRRSGAADTVEPSENGKADHATAN